MKNYIRKFTGFVVLAFVAVTSLSAKEYVIGGEKGWGNLNVTDNLTTAKGRYGYESLEVAPSGFKGDAWTDLIVNFENPYNPVDFGNYSVVQNSLSSVADTALGKTCGLSRNQGGITLRGNDYTLFGSEGLTGSFSIEFWLNPSLVENGETIFQWHSSRNVDNRILFQQIGATFNSGKLEWSLSNIFDLFYEGTSDLKLKGTSTIIPKTWSCHVISFDSETGILEYLVNGLVEDIKYITSTGHEDGNISHPILGVAAEFDLVPDYTGKIDDFRIMRRPYTAEKYQSAEMAGSLDHMKYIPTGGHFETKPIRISKGCTLNSVTAEMSVPGETAVELYVRSGENFYNWTDSYPEWKIIESGEELSGITGLYFQIAGNLFPDGNGSTTPNLTQITLDYTELPEPLPPFSINAVAGDKCVTISWNASVDETTGGYYLYYGNRSGEYLGRVALEGNSPVNVGNTTSFTLTGLNNGTIYYFAVASWSKYDKSVTGNLSKEVFARPRSKK